MTPRIRVPRPRRFASPSSWRPTLSQRGSKRRRSRKRKRAAGGGRSSGGAAGNAGSPGAAANAGSPAAAGKQPSRSEAKNQAAREALVPLREGERPLAVTIGAIVAAALAIGNLVAYALGFEVGDERPPLALVIGQAAIMLVAAVGMWRARYWAVLGMQALLGLLIVFVAVAGLTASNALAVVVVLAIVIPAGTLFWFLVKAMARIQMPTRR